MILGLVIGFLSGGLTGTIITQGIYTQVFVELATGVFERRRVSLRLQDRDFTYLGGEVSAGERIVVAGALLLNSELLESR